MQNDNILNYDKWKFTEGKDFNYYSDEIEKLQFAYRFIEDIDYFWNKLYLLSPINLSSDIPSFCISIDRRIVDKSKVTINDIKIYANLDFVCQFSKDEVTFILMHELMHYSLGHIFDRSISVSDLKLANRATDCIINDTLTNWGFIMPKLGICGREILNVDCSLKTTDEVMDLLRSNSKTIENITPNFDEHDFDSLPDELKQILQDQYEEILVDMYRKGLLQGKKSSNKLFGDVPPISKSDILKAKITAENNSSNVKNISNTYSKTQFNFIKVWKKELELKFGFGSISGQETYAKINRRTTAIPEIRIPVFSKERIIKKNIVFALDTSGSVTDEQVEIFSIMINSIPRDLCNIHAFSFGDKNELSPATITKKSVQFQRFGGTDFNQINKYIDKHLQKIKLDGLYILTDGEWNGKLESDKYPKKTVWIIDTSVSIGNFSAFTGDKYLFSTFVQGNSELKL